MDDGKQRILMITAGRSGSSLLAAIIADAGGDFGMPPPVDWSQTSGSMEHPLAQKAGRLFRRAYYLRRGKRFFLLYKYLIDSRRSRGKKLIRELLAKAKFVKADSIDLWAGLTPKFGYQPVVVASYRNFSDNARSLFVLRGMQYDDIVEYYCRVNQNALLLLDTFGGCAVSQEELVDPRETAWASALAAATELDEQALLKARDARLKSDRDRRPDIIQHHAPTAEAIYQQLEQLKGQYIRPSRQISR